MCKYAAIILLYCIQINLRSDRPEHKLFIAILLLFIESYNSEQKNAMSTKNRTLSLSPQSGHTGKAHQVIIFPPIQVSIIK